MSSTIAPVYSAENHDAAFAQWVASGSTGRTLIHLDAHHDLWPVPAGAGLTTASFIWPAIGRGIVSHIYWVVPDQSLADPEGRRCLERHVRDLRARDPQRSQPAQWTDGTLRARLFGIPLVICRVDELPTVARPVFLDVDVDYFVIPRVSHGAPDVRSELPWIWPPDLVGRLHARALRWDLATIAYSVDGGFTPLRWKYLGDELAACLRGDSTRTSAFALMRTAAEAELAGDLASAERGYRDVGDTLGGAAHFNLAHLLARRNRLEEARVHYHRARVLDPSYRTLFASPGVPQWLDGDLRAASRSFALTRQLDPDDAASGIGLGSIAAEEGRWLEAEAYARHVLARDPDSIDAHRLLARVLVHENRNAEAIGHYERSLLLALSGERPLDGLLTSAPGPDRLLDDAHARVHAELAGLYARVGDLRRAVTAYRMAMAGGCSNLALTLRLAACLWRQGHPAAAGRQLLAGTRQLPSAVRLRLRRARRRLMRP